MAAHIKSLILSKDYFNRRQAESYVRHQKQYKPLKMDEKPKTWRFRLRVPDETRYEYKIKPFTEGVKAVIGFFYHIKYINSYFKEFYNV